MSDCIFCKIGSGEIKANIVYQTDTIAAFRDLNPQAPVHILFIPKKHIDRISVMDEANLPLLVDIHRAIQKVAKDEKLVENGFRIVNNEGVERIFPLHSPNVLNIVPTRSGKVRRAKLYFLRQRTGKAVRLQQRHSDHTASR